MTSQKQPEVWLRGPVPGVAPLMQPVAHALLQASEEAAGWMVDFPESLLWEKPAGLASVGFHLQHLSGVLDRMFSYARGESLTQEKLTALATEGKPEEMKLTVKELLSSFQNQIEKALEQLRNTPEDSLLQPRSVGRRQISSTVLGLLFHAAEHSQRHIGQLLVTSRILRANGITH